MKKIIFWGLVLLAWCCQDKTEVVRPEVRTSAFTDPRDNTVYQCITVGDQTWMAENLRFKLRGGAYDGCWTWNEEIKVLKTTDFVNLAMDYVFDDLLTWDEYDEIEAMYFDGSEYKEIIEVMGDRIPQQLIDDFYKTKGDKDYLQKYGYLYSYEAALKAIPEGWRLPTDEDWQTLEMNIGLSHSEATVMNDWRGSRIGDLLKTGEEGIGFNALYAGGKVYGIGKKVNLYTRKDVNAYFWSSTVIADTDSTKVAVLRSIELPDSRILRFTSRLDNTAYSVRCIKK